MVQWGDDQDQENNRSIRFVLGKLRSDVRRCQVLDDAVAIKRRERQEVKDEQHRVQPYEYIEKIKEKLWYTSSQSKGAVYVPDRKGENDQEQVADWSGNRNEYSRKPRILEHKSIHGDRSGPAETSNENQDRSKWIQMLNWIQRQPPLLLRS